MQLKKFIKEIESLKPSEEELNRIGVPVSELDRWEIDVLDDEFGAYDGPIYQMVYCVDTIKLFSGFEQLSRIDSDAPDPYKIWGINTYYDFYYAYSYENNEIVLLDDLKSPEPNMYCAASGAKLLDCLLIVAQYEKLRVLEPVKAEREREEWIQKAAKAAGGKKYMEHSKILIG